MPLTERDVREVGEISLSHGFWLLDVNMGGESNHFKRQDYADEVPLKEVNFFSGPQDTQFIWLSSSVDYYSLQKAEELVSFAIRIEICFWKYWKSCTGSV